MPEFLLVYAIIINALAFFMFKADKQRAKKGSWRISEKCLLTLAFAGGSLGALLGMKLFRHKIRKPLFYISVPLFLVLQTGIIIFAAYKIL